MVDSHPRGSAPGRFAGFCLGRLSLKPQISGADSWCVLASSHTITTSGLRDNDVGFSE